MSPDMGALVTDLGTDYGCCHDSQHALAVREGKGVNRYGHAGTQEAVTAAFKRT
jgi:hypothetical protein